MTISSKERNKRSHNAISSPKSTKARHHPYTRPTNPPPPTLKLFKTLPAELRNQIYTYLSLPSPTYPLTPNPPFTNKVYKIGKTTTTITALSSPATALLALPSLESQEYKSHLYTHATTLCVKIHFYAEPPHGFHANDWDAKMARRLENLVKKFPVVRRWPIRVEVEWSPAVKDALNPKFGFDRDAVIGRMVERMFSITDERFRGVERVVSVVGDGVR